jgi:hypothetical protein
MANAKFRFSTAFGEIGRRGWTWLAGILIAAFAALLGPSANSVQVSTLATGFPEFGSKISSFHVATERLQVMGRPYAPRMRMDQTSFAVDRSFFRTARDQRAFQSRARTSSHKPQAP